MLSPQCGKPLPGGRLAAKEIGKLRRGYLQGFGHRTQVAGGCYEMVESLRQNRWIVFMAGRNNQTSLTNL